MKKKYLKKILNKQNIIWVLQLITAAGMAVFSYKLSNYIRYKYDQHSVISQFQSFVSVLKKYPDTHLEYSGLNNYYIKMNLKHELAKKDIIVFDDNTIESVHGGIFIVASAPSVVGSTREDAYIITYANLSLDRCLTLATYDWSKLSDVRVIGVLASSYSTGMDFQTMYWGCNGESRPEISTTACTNGNQVSIPMKEEDALTGCRCRYNNCSVSLKLY